MIQTLVSVPPLLDAWLRSSARGSATPLSPVVDYVGSDPAGTRLGSGGGTVSLLYRAWAETSRTVPIAQWLRASQKLVLHAGGESRRLPAYATVGKALLPVPSSLGHRPARFDQVLSDVQLPLYQRVLAEAGAHAALLVASGDVWLDFDPLSVPVVTADVAGIGMRVPAEVAQHFGVFFVDKSPASTGVGGEHDIAFFLQKPSPEVIYRHAARYDFFVDTGLWMFSAPGVEFLFRRCGWEGKRFAAGKQPEYLDLYTEIGAVLGRETRTPAALRRHGFSALRRSVIPLENARFLHVGSSRQLLESYEQLATGSVGGRKVFFFATPSTSAETRSNLPVFIDSGSAASKWTLGGFNVVSGSAPGMAALHLAQGQCLEIAPVGKTGYVVRPYALDDRFRGSAAGSGTICGTDAETWLRARNLAPSNADVFTVAIYPILPAEEITPELLSWFFDASPAANITQRLSRTRKLSAAEIPNAVNLDRYFAQRQSGHSAVLLGQFSACLKTGDARVLEQDFAAIAAHAQRDAQLAAWLRRQGPTLAAQLPRPEHRSRVLMLLAELSSRTTKQDYTRRAHAELQHGVITADQFPPCQPRLALKEDQIVWGRSPVRLDLAGGWTDTPPYCLEHGGAVLNVAVLLNGQPPIQVFVRPLSEPTIRLRSIDLGSAEAVTTYAGLATFRDPQSGFSLPKAALAMAGFLPEFSAGRPASTLRERLKRFGGGLEISLLSAVPKGSGLGTSSILAATILGALNRACTLGWDELSLYNRVLGVEQLLTTGGGWQDQAGALFRGIKLVETNPGPAQSPTVRYLPEHLFGPAQANRTLLLYYTGITRLAKGILKEIVHDMFLARDATLQTLGLIRSNAHALFRAVQQNDPKALNRCIARSWELNKQLDPGTTNPQIDAILGRCGADAAAAKLLGAGGGGYMLICAHDPDAAQRIRTRLEKHPPNRRARFIDFEIAKTGLEVTVS